MKFRITLDVAGRKVSMYKTKIPNRDRDLTGTRKSQKALDGLGDFNLTVWTKIFKILVAEDQHLPLGSKQSKFIQA